jgi:hypothetical protein
VSFTGAAPHAIALRTLLRTYLNAEVDAIDTAANELLSDIDEFTTPELAEEDIQLFREDREGECITVVIQPQAVANPRGIQKHGAGTGQARMDFEHEFIVYVTARSNLGGWGEHGAWYRADRVLHGVLATILKYPQNDSSITFWCEMGGWTRLPEEAEMDTMAVNFAANVTVRDRAVA